MRRGILGRRRRRSIDLLMGGLASVWVSGCAAPPRAPFDTVVEADQLADALASAGRTDLKILDARDADAYAREHVAGAVLVDVKEWQRLSLGESTGLDHRAAWFERLGALGVDGADTVVIHDDGRMTEAVRIWFILQHFGVARAAVLNGGYPALAPLIAEGRITVSHEATPPKPTTFRPSDSSSLVGLADRERVRRDVKDGTAQVFDARTLAEHGGSDPRGNPRAGHLPGAINVSHRDLLDERGRLKPSAELEAIFERAGFERGHPLITHCQSGGRASLAALAASRAGYGPVWNYYLSFGDWARDATCPIVQGEAD